MTLGLACSIHAASKAPFLITYLRIEPRQRTTIHPLSAGSSNCGASKCTNRDQPISDKPEVAFFYKIKNIFDIRDQSNAGLLAKTRSSDRGTMAQWATSDLI